MTCKGNIQTQPSYKILVYFSLSLSHPTGIHSTHSVQTWLNHHITKRNTKITAIWSTVTDTCIIFWLMIGRSMIFSPLTYPLPWALSYGHVPFWKFSLVISDICKVTLSSKAELISLSFKFDNWMKKTRRRIQELRWVYNTRSEFGSKTTAITI